MSTLHCKIPPIFQYQKRELTGIRTTMLAGNV